MATVTKLDVVDVRFPTSTQLDGSDAMNPDPDYSAASATLHVDGRTCEWVEHLHEHFEEPATVQAGHYVTPTAAGFSARMLDAPIARYRFPEGAEWGGGA